MNLPWIKVYSALPRHPKSRELGHLLRRPRAWTNVLELWLWASEQCPDGDLGGLSDRTIAECAGWAGNATAFVEALRSVGFLDGYQLHDWAEHQPMHVEAAEEEQASTADRTQRLRDQARERAQRRRERERSKRDASVTERDDVTGERDASVTERDASRSDSVTERDENTSQRAPAKTETESETETKKTTTPAPSSGAVGGSSRLPEQGTLVPSAEGAPKKVFETQVTEVLRHWQREVERPDWAVEADASGVEAKIAGKRRKRVRARLAEGFTVADLCTAADHVRNDAWLWDQRGAGDDRYRDVDTVYRDAGQVKRLIKLVQPVQTPPGGPRAADPPKPPSHNPLPPDTRPPAKSPEEAAATLQRMRARGFTLPGLRSRPRQAGGQHVEPESNAQQTAAAGAAQEGMSHVE